MLLDVAEVMLRTSGPRDTQAIAAAAAASLRAGDVVALSGELGAGKTCFVQGVARALGVRGRVTSPTFTLVRTYPESTPPVVHCDVYRLDRLQDVLELGDEVMAPDVVTCIEWGDAVVALLPPDRLEVELWLEDPSQGDGVRLIRLRGVGAWAMRIPALREACRAWVDGQPPGRDRLDGGA